ncbi:MAG: DUF4347 domain-containing protein [Xenococcaceae cyanobacterium MO_188.B29]|nr:DUF4347 domain-containing protein [Xenococcaceae cyanobacterium MO_188.B29]
MNYQTNTYRQNRRSIAFVDAEVVKNQNFIANLNLETELILIDSNRDGIKQITEILAERRNINSLQIITTAQGNEGSINLGLTQLNIHTIEAYIDDLQQWKNALSATPEIMLYGCLVLVESIFQNFIHQLAKITEADIGAFVTFPDNVMANNQEIDPYSLMVAWRS